MEVHAHTYFWEFLMLFPAVDERNYRNAEQSAEHHINLIKQEYHLSEMTPLEK